jgi:hypothetical protein
MDAAGGPRPALGAVLALVAVAGGLFLLAFAAVGAGAPGPLPIGAAGCALLALWGATVSMGERALGPLGLEAPLAAGIVAGLLMGRLPEGIVAGITVQAIWTGIAPMGASREPAAGLAAIVTAAWLAFLPAGLDAWRAPFALGAGLAAASWGTSAEVVLRRRNERRVDRLLTRPPDSWHAGAAAAGRAGLIEAGLRGVIAVLALAGLPLLAALVVVQWTGTPIWQLPAAPGSAWSARLPIWGMTPALAFALGGAARLGVRGWRARWPAAAPPADGGGPTAAKTRGRLWRLLTIQTAFNEKHLQRAGFLAALRPAGEPARRLQLEIAAGPPPNTHPVMAAALFGALDRVVEDEAAGASPRPPSRLIELGGPLLAQWGDRALWGAARTAWALAGLAAAPLAGLPVALVFLAVATAAHILARPALYLWGRRAGWDLVRGGRGWLWGKAPRVAERAALPLALAATGVMAVSWAVAGPHAAASGLRAGWFMLGALLGGSVRRPATWGRVCWVAAATGAALDLWLAQSGL